MIINVNVVIFATCRVSKCSQIIQKVLEFVDEDKTPFGLTYINIPNTKYVDYGLRQAGDR